MFLLPPEETTLLSPARWRSKCSSPFSSFSKRFYFESHQLMSASPVKLSRRRQWVMEEEESNLINLKR